MANGELNTLFKSFHDRDLPADLTERGCADFTGADLPNGRPERGARFAVRFWSSLDAADRQEAVT